MFEQTFYLTLAAWWLAGFVGGIHCLGMCGGLTTALGLNLAGKQQALMLLAANLGRLLSYTLIGGLLGGVSGVVAWLPRAVLLQTGLYLVSLLLIVLLGCYLAGWSGWLLRLERLGGPLWQRLQPRFAALLPLRSTGAALLAGGLWGWLPCGLVYTAATGALASGSSVRGGAILLAFGLGTLPNLLLMGAAAGRLQRLRDKVWVRRLAGGGLVAYGLVALGMWLMAR